MIKLTLLCVLAWYALYFSIGYGLPRLRRGLLVVYRCRKTDNQARDLYNSALIFLVGLVPLQGLVTAQLLTGLFVHL